MPYGSGLSGQIGFINESVWGTPVTVTKFPEFLSESLNWEPTWLDSAGLKAGQAYKRVTRTKQSRFTVTGGFEIEAPDKGLGLLLKHAMGSPISAPTLIATTAYKQVHVPGTKAGFGLTLQVGRPQPDGTVRAFTYEGCKITAWEFSCSDGEVAKWSFDIVGQDMSTATGLAAATYTASTSVFSFNEATTFKIGGTPSTSSGETTIATGVTVATVVNGITIRGETPMKDDRFGLGNAGAMQEPIENGIPTVTATLDGEFTQRTEFYDLMKANTTTALQVDFSHGDAGSSNAFLTSFILPACKIKTGNVNVSGPDVLGQQITVEAYDNGADPAVQVKLVSTDATL
jgi:Phage tail tube protein